MESSNGETSEAYLGMHLEMALKLPIKERIAVQDFGGETAASADML